MEVRTWDFFKDFKDDFSQAVNELMPGEDISKARTRMMTWS